jgi:PAS domain S-box-containing protein
MAFALALFALLTVILLFDRIRSTRATRALLNALTKAGTTSGDPFFHALAANLGQAFKADPDAIASLSNVFTQRAFLETKRRQSDQALQASEAKTRAILQALPDLMFVQDRDGKFVDYYAATNLYTTPEMFLGKSFLEVLPPEAAAIIDPAFRRVVDSGQAEAFEYQLTISGEVRSFEARMVQLPPDNVLSIVRDLTEAKRAANALEKSRYFAQRLAETIPNVVFLYDLISQRNVYVNERSEPVLGYTAQEVMEMGDQFLPRTMHPDDVAALPRLGEMFDRARDGEIIENLSRFRHKNGEWRWISRCATVFARDAEGRPTQILGSAADVTALKTAEEELRSLSARLRNTQDEERRRIARELHDGVAQCLFGISAFLATLRASVEVPSREADTLAEVAHHCEEGLKQVRLLSYVLHPPMLDEVGLTSALKWFVDGLERRSNIEIELEAEDEMERLPIGVERDLFRIVQEALSNVVRHSGSPKAVVRLIRQSDLAMVQIQDFGCGMPTGYEPGDQRQQAGGLGIVGMRERLHYVNGRLEIQTGPQGTTLTAIVPLGVEAMSS